LRRGTLLVSVYGALTAWGRKRLALNTKTGPAIDAPGLRYGLDQLVPGAFIKGPLPG